MPEKKRPETIAEVVAALAEPFPPSLVSWRPADFKTNRQENGKNYTPAVPYLDVRAVQDRLDAVFGPDNWFPRYVVMPGGEVECQLSCRFPGRDEWIMKPDVGSRIEDDENGVKAAYTDALKRAAVLFGIGRYLYRVPKMMTEWNPAQGAKYLIGTPQLPQWALPEDYRRAGPDLAASVDTHFAELAALVKGEKTAFLADALKALRYEPNVPLATIERRHARKLIEDAKSRKDQAPLPKEYPQTGPELQERLNAYDATLSEAGHCKPGELVAYVVRCGVKAGFPSALSEYTKNSQIRAATGWAKQFDTDRRPKKSPPQTRTEPAAAR